MKLLLENWRKFITEDYEPVTTLRIFDFDETIAHTTSETRVTAPDGSTATLRNQKEFEDYMKAAAAKEGIETFDPVRDLQELGYKIDLSDFSGGLFLQLYHIDQPIKRFLAQYVFHLVPCLRLGFLFSL